MQTANAILISNFDNGNINIISWLLTKLNVKRNDLFTKKVRLDSRFE